MHILNKINFITQPVAKKAAVKKEESSEEEESDEESEEESEEVCFNAFNILYVVKL